MTVTCVNDPPDAVNDSASTDEDTAKTFPASGAGSLKANDTDVDNTNAQLFISSVSDPANGAAVLNADGSVTYTPDSNYYGPDSFTYSLCDPGQDGNAATAGDNLCDTATVSMTVNAVNDPPDAVNDSASTDEDTAKTFPASGAGSLKANDTDVDNTNAQLFISSVSDPANGTAVLNADGSVTYTPDSNYYGPDSFTYSLCDPGQDGNAATAGDNLCDTATVSMTVNAVNDPPDAVNDSASTDEDTAKTFPASGAGSLKANDTDVDNTNAQLFISSVSDPANGTAVLNADGSVTYTPDSNYYGPDSFTYSLCDPGQDGNAATAGDNLCDTATVSMTVNAVNDPPDAVNDSASTDEDAAKTFPASGAGSLKANDTDVDNTNAQLFVSSVSDPANGTAVLNARRLGHLHPGQQLLRAGQLHLLALRSRPGRQRRHRRGQPLRHRHRHDDRQRGQRRAGRHCWCGQVGERERHGSGQCHVHRCRIGRHAHLLDQLG